jgi:hypothetical protein
MPILDVAAGIIKLFAGSPDAEEPWAQNEEIFEQHFGVPYEEFCYKLTILSADQHKRYHETLKVNPEAAVLWVVMQEDPYG